MDREKALPVSSGVSASFHRRAGRVAVAALVLLAGLGPAGSDADDTVVFARDRLTIETSDGRSHRFEVELAVTPRQRARGLMFRREMAPHEGMLFVFEEEDHRSFWMKNTLLALDLIFIDRWGAIVGVARDAVPLDPTPIPSGVPAAGVLEVLAGTVDRLSLAVGDRVVHAAFRE